MLSWWICLRKHSVASGMVWWKPRGVSQTQRAARPVVGLRCGLCGSGTGAEQEGETGERGGDSSSKALHTILKMRSL